MRFHSDGARSARRLSGYGGAVGALIGYSIASGIERNNEVVEKLANANGPFESQQLNDQIQLALTRQSVNNASESVATLNVRLRVAGLDEIEPKRFVAFGVAQAELRDSAGKQVWEAAAEATSINSRPLSEYEREPGLYRKDFAEVAEDLARQLIEGPVRHMSR